VRQQVEKPVTSQGTLPKLISRIKNLEIVGATVQGEGRAGAQVAIEVKNNSDLAVYYFAVTNGNVKTSEYGVARNGLVDPDSPQVAIEPLGTATLNIPLANLDARHPILLSAAVFSDGSEVGEESALEQMRSVRARDKAG
jgi:hypothetical protein